MAQKVWGTDGFLFFIMGIIMLMLALYVLTGEAVVRRVEWTPMEQRLMFVEHRLTQLEAPPIPAVKKRWWQR